MQSVPYAPIVVIDFTTPVQQRWKMIGELPHGGKEVACEDNASTSTTVPSDGICENIYKPLSESIIPGHCEAYPPVEVNGAQPPLSDLFKTELGQKVSAKLHFK